MNICIITGSTLGGAEYVGDHVAARLEAQGFDTQVENEAVFADVADCNLWLIVTSTHGAGDLPENLKPFMREAEQQDLSNVRFAVIGLGNSDYDTFCQAVDTVEQTLAARGAKKLCDSLRIDVLNVDDPEQAAEDWLPNFVQSL